MGAEGPCCIGVGGECASGCGCYGGLRERAVFGDCGEGGLRGLGVEGRKEVVALAVGPVDGGHCGMGGVKDERACSRRWMPETRLCLKLEL